MKKNLLLFVFTALGFLKMASQSPTISVWSTSLCANSTAYASVTGTVPSATSYSWTIIAMSCSANLTPAPNGLSTFITYPCCGNYTITCSAYNGSTFLSSTINTVNVACTTASAVPITSSSNGTLCSGNTATLSSTGNVTYTWIPGNVSGANMVVNPSSNICYTVLAYNAQGCFNMSASYCMSVIPTYSIAISGNTTVCAGSSATLSLSGGPSFNTIPGNINSSTPVLTPSVTTLYSIVCPSGIYPCPSTSVMPIIVNPVPFINVSNSTNSNTICWGNTATLTGSGATTYTWSTGSTGPSIIVNPTSNTCYSVIGSGMNGCNNMATYCFSVLALPNVYVNGAAICLGSSFTFSASGANSYTWLTNPTVNSATMNVLPLSPTYYTLTGTGANGCIGSDTAWVYTHTICAMVWPGDANRDGIVSTSDVLELGLAAFSTGAARSSTSNAWAAQFASAWTGSVSTGWNKAHADCNGDGVINASDATAIFSNFSFTHSFKPEASSVNPDIKLVASSNSGLINQWNKVDIVLGDVSNNISQLYGVAFDINYDKNLIETDSVKLNYTASFLNASNQNITFQKAIHTNGKEYVASVRVDQANVNGNGKIGEFWFKTKSNISNNTPITLSASNAQKVSANGIFSNLNTDAGITLNLNTGTALRQYLSAIDFVRCYPNPSNQQLVLSSTLNGTVQYEMQDVLGRVIIKGEFNGSQVINVSQVNAGTYFISFMHDSNKSGQRLVIEH